jgi:hypothetical protein
MGIRDDFCEDFDNPAVWAVIHNSTAFRFDYTVTEPKLDLYKLPSSLIDPSPVLNNRINLVLPDKPLFLNQCSRIGQRKIGTNCRLE